MFMTFKPSAKDRNGGAKAMQQVAASDASHGTSRNRFGASRRPACSRCQVKKLRCTGVGESCDRCRLQHSTCVADPTARQRGRRKAASAQSNTAPAIPSHGRQPEQGININGTPDASDAGNQGPTPDSSIWHQGQSVHDATPRARSRSRSHSLAIDPELSRPLFTESLPQISPPGSNPQSPINLPRISEILGSRHHAAANHQSPPTESAAAAAAVATLERGEGAVEQDEQGLIPAVTRGSTKLLKGEAPDSCDCISEMLDIVQKLDDDCFRLSTLTFDQVLKVQKYLIFHCLKPLDCESCADQSAAHTVVLIICDRATQMMACLSGRVTQTTKWHGSCAWTEGDSTWTSTSTPTDSSTTIPAALPPLPGRKIPNALISLFDGETGKPGMSVRCNTDMFSPDFQAQYSNEELFRMIRELARIQAKNMDRLLGRVEAMPQARGSAARMGRITVLRERMDEAAREVDAGFEHILKNLEG